MKTSHEVTLPDGTTRSRASDRIYTHAVVARGERGWGVVGYCGSPELAQKRAADWRRRVPSEPCRIVPVRPTVPLTAAQRAFLLEIGDGAREVFTSSSHVALIRRGLLERHFIGQRWWRIKRTAAGKAAVTSPA